ncbi:hypothetical protein FHW79_001659 [Azospirillum sp. OGB3]|uniref:hypothetical protein n=1 Tax=Azospirillum sp. OGB3 TaxID=2587012 RepID=UPI0016056950|nr:hypothetical protein [Azospirillum sp. OGB3]MBB3264044.1 hypothetical protein [Azospirillum sp. OGB3]
MPTDEAIIKAACIQATAILIAKTNYDAQTVDKAADLTARLAFAMWRRFDQIDPSVTQQGKDATP